MIFNYEIKDICIKYINEEMIKVEPVSLEVPQPIYMGIDAASMEGWAEAVMYFKEDNNGDYEVDR